MRSKPYTVIGIRRVKCSRCGERAEHQWKVCADRHQWRPICLKCDIALNALVLRWMRDPEANAKIARYRKENAA